MDHAVSPSTTLLREERKRVAGVNIKLSWPQQPQPKGVAFLLSGAMISVSEYSGLRDAILKQQHLVVGLSVNVLWPLRNNHRKHAQEVKRVFDELGSMYVNLLPNSYAIVGHSVGGKIALLLASITDPKRVSGVLALDPVDINPTEFSNKKGHNLSLDDGIDLLRSEDDDHEQNISQQGKKHTPILLTCTDGGRGIPETHNAIAINKFHPATICYRHNHAGHMAYCDNGGGVAGKLMPNVGTAEGNEKARDAAHDLIRQILI